MPGAVRADRRTQGLRALTPPLRWFGVIVAASVVVGGITGALAGSQGATQDSCKAMTCVPTRFVWASATRAGSEAAIAIFVIGCLAAVAIRALLRFAESPPRGNGDD